MLNVIQQSILANLVPKFPINKSFFVGVSLISFNDNIWFHADHTFKYDYRIKPKKSYMILATKESKPKNWHCLWGMALKACCWKIVDSHSTKTIKVSN